MEHIGAILRQRREELKLTLEALARRVGATKGYLSLIENRKLANPPSAELVAALEKALKIEDGALRAAAAWQSTPAEVRRQVSDLSARADAARELALFLRKHGRRRKDGSRGLDEMFRTGELARRVKAALGEAGEPDVRAIAPSRARVPLINKVAAGYPRDFTDLDYPARVADEYVGCPDVADPDAFAARVVGESMLPDYREGDIVIFSPAAAVADGCDCFVRLEPDHETTFKRVFFEDKDGKPRGPKGPGASGKAADHVTHVRLQPLNAAFKPRRVRLEHVAGMYRAVARMQKL